MSAARIVYISWPAAEIAGGIKMAFRHVEGLRELGFEAAIATEDAAPPGWFETTAPVLPLDSLSPEDVLVFPENYRAQLERFAGWKCRKVVFCQSHSMVWRGVLNGRGYEDYGVSSILSCGAAVTHFCRRRFPGMPVSTVPNYIDLARFRCPSEKKLHIAFAPRKRPLEAQVINDLLRAEHAALRDVPWVEIVNRSEEEVAKILSESALFLSLCRFEACPLTPLEALASGCIVAGFTGHGGREYATLANGFWAAEDDCLECEEMLACAARLVLDGGPAYQQMVAAGVATARRYSRERFLKALQAFWSEVVA